MCVCVWPPPCAVPRKGGRLTGWHANRVRLRAYWAAGAVGVIAPPPRTPPPHHDLPVNGAGGDGGGSNDVPIYSGSLFKDGSPGLLFYRLPAASASLAFWPHELVRFFRPPARLSGYPAFWI